MNIFQGSLWFSVGIYGILLVDRTFCLVVLPCDTQLAFPNLLGEFIISHLREELDFIPGNRVVSADSLLWGGQGTGDGK